MQHIRMPPFFRLVSLLFCHSAIFMMSDDVTMNNHTSITILGSYRAVWHLSKVLKKLTMAMKRIYKCCNYYIMHIC